MEATPAPENSSSKGSVENSGYITQLKTIPSDVTNDNEKSGSLITNLKDSIAFVDKCIESITDLTKTGSDIDPQVMTLLQHLNMKCNTLHNAYYYASNKPQ